MKYPIIFYKSHNYDSLHILLHQKKKKMFKKIDKKFILQSPTVHHIINNSFSMNGTKRRKILPIS